MGLNHTLNLRQPPLEATRDGYGRGLVEVGEKNERVCVITGDLRDSTRTAAFAKKWPERFVEAGIAEQNMVGLAAGLAATGKIPFVATYAAFVPGRAYDQIRVQVAYSQANVKLSGAHSGLGTGPDGATHQMLEDVAMMRALPNMVVLAPADAEETRKAVHLAAEYVGPVYLRFGRPEAPTFTTESTPLTIGKAGIFRTGSDISIISCGSLTYLALLAAEKLESDGISAEVLHSPSIKPLDRQAILQTAVKTKRVLVCEEAETAGGLGGAVAELLGQELPTQIGFVSVHDQFGQSGEPGELARKYEVDEDAIIASARRMVGRAT